MSVHRPQASAEGRKASSVSSKGKITYRSAATGRYYSEEARSAAARALLAADKKRGRATEPSIVRLAERGGRAA